MYKAAMVRDMHALSHESRQSISNYASDSSTYTNRMTDYDP